MFSKDLRLSTSLTPHGLRRQAEYTYECPPHSFAIRKARLPRYCPDGVPAVFANLANLGVTMKDHSDFTPSCICKGFGACRLIENGT
jgi:hypothetical protein